MSNRDVRKRNREYVERLELKRDVIIDVISVFGPLAAPAVPAVLTAMSIATHYPSLLGIPQWVATIIAIVSAIVTEILGIAAVDMLFDMISFNNTKGDDEDEAPVTWAWVIVGTYITIILGLVVVLKIMSGLAIASLIPLTLLGFITVWCIVLRSQHTERKYQRQESDENADVMSKLRELVSSDDVVDAVKQLVTSRKNLDKLVKELTDKLDNACQERDDVVKELTEKLDKTCQELEDKRDDVVKELTEKLDNACQERDDAVKELQAHLDNATREKTSKTLTSKTRQATHDRRRQVLQLLTTTSSKDEINFAEWASDLDTSRQTISQDYKKLLDNKLWLNGSDWTITREGLEYLNE